MKYNNNSYLITFVDKIDYAIFVLIRLATERFDTSENGRYCELYVQINIMLHDVICELNITNF